MARSEISGNHPLRKVAQEEKLFRATAKDLFFAPLMGGSDMPVHVKTDLEGKKGTEVRFGLRRRMTGQGVTGNQLLKGNEERITFPDDAIRLERFRHGVIDDGSLSNKQVEFNVSEELKDALKTWGQEKLDQLAFEAMGLTASPTARQEFTHIVYPAGAGGTFTLTQTPNTARAALNATGSRLTLDLLGRLRTVAKTGLNRRINPLRPIKIDGQDYYLYVTHDDALVDLRESADYKAAMQNAAERGKNNPLFKSVDAVWQNVMVKTHENCAIATDGGGASVPWTKGAFMGAQALCWAWGERPSFVTEKDDYEEFEGTAWRVTCQASKPRFEGADFGVIGVYTARTNLSGIAIS